MSKNEIDRSSKYAWTYLGQERNTIENQLEKAGWKQNYSGKTNLGMHVVLYVYNRPTDINWRPCHFYKYSYAEQKNNQEALENLLQSGKVYGEIYLMYSEGVAVHIGMFWLFPTANYNSMEIYKSFSNNIYKCFLADVGNAVIWQGNINNSISYRSHEQMMNALEEYSRPTIAEEVHSTSTSHNITYYTYGTYDYYFKNSFYMLFDGEKY